MNLFLSITDKINTIVKYIASLFLILLAILVVFQVIARFIINFPLSWSEEVSRYIMVYIVFLGSALAVRYKQHISIDFLVEIVSPKNKKNLTNLILLINAIFFALLVYYGSLFTLAMYKQATPALQFSMAWAYAAVPIGSLLMLINTVAVFIETNTKSKDGGEVE